MGFKQMTNRNDIGVVIIGQHIADMIRHTVNEYQAEGKVIPTILEVPNKDHPYNPNTDSVMHGSRSSWAVAFPASTAKMRCSLCRFMEFEPQPGREESMTRRPPRFQA